jgi:hypothetical protein
MLAAVLWTLAALVLAALAGLIWLPVRVEGRVARAERLEARLTLGLYGGLLPVRIDGGRRRPESQAPEPEARERPRRRRRFRRGGAMLRAAPDLIGGVLRAVGVERLRVDGAFGLADPADTGQLFGLLCPLLYALPPSPRREIALRPVFDGPTLSGEAEGRVAVTLAPALGAALRFGWRVLWNR